MNKIIGQRAKARPFDRIAPALATLLATSLLVNSAPAGPPLRATARTITGELLRAPEKLKAATDFTTAKEPPIVDFVQVPLPETTANPWSIWGYGLRNP